MRKTKKRKAQKMRAWENFHKQSQTCGGLVKVTIVKRGELSNWLMAAATDDRAYRVLKAASRLLENWDREANRLLCLTCDNSVADLSALDALAFVLQFDETGEAMVLPLCTACAKGRDLHKRVMAALKRMIWPEIREAPPIHTQGGTA